MHTEAARQFYLRAAGVRMWYAREPLPGAAPSPDFDFSADSDDAVAPELGVTASAVPAQPDPEQAARSRDKIAHLQSLMSAVEAPANTPRPPKTPEPQHAVVEGKAGAPEDSPVPVAEPAGVSAQVPDAVPRLFIQAWEGDRFMLVAEMSEDASLSLQETLATNILRSLGESSSKRLSGIHWPLFNNLKVSLNRVEHLLEAISESYGKGGDRQLIVLGNAANWIEEALGNAPVVQFSGNLAKLASEPLLKRELWQMIKPLAAL